MVLAYGLGVGCQAQEHWSLALGPNNFRSFSAHLFPGFGSHRDPFALETFHEVDLQPFLFQAL